MLSITKLIGSASGTLALISSTAAYAESLPIELRKAAQLYDRAQITGDRRLFEQSLASDYLLVNSGGQVESRAQFIAESVDHEFKLEPYEVEQPNERWWGNSAIMGGLVHLRGSDHGSHFEADLRFVDFWVKRRGKWQVVFTQVTKAPARRAKAE